MKEQPPVWCPKCGALVVVETAYVGKTRTRRAWCEAQCGYKWPADKK